MKLTRKMGSDEERLGMYTMRTPLRGQLRTSVQRRNLGSRTPRVEFCRQEKFEKESRVRGGLGQKDREIRKEE